MPFALSVNPFGTVTPVTTTFEVEAAVDPLMVSFAKTVVVILPATAEKVSFTA